MAIQHFDLTSQGFKRDPFPTFARMREAGAFIRIKLPIVGAVWVTTTYEAVTRIMRDQKNFVLEPRNIPFQSRVSRDCPLFAQLSRCFARPGEYVMMDW